MRSSGLKESVFVAAAAAFGIAASQSWRHDQPDRCPRPSPASVEMLFAPCLAGMPAPPSDLLKLEFARPVAPAVREPGPAREPAGGEVDATSSIRIR